MRALMTRYWLCNYACCHRIMYNARSAWSYNICDDTHYHFTAMPNLLPASYLSWFPFPFTLQAWCYFWLHKRIPFCSLPSSPRLCAWFSPGSITTNWLLLMTLTYAFMSRFSSPTDYGCVCISTAFSNFDYHYKISIFLGLIFVGLCGYGSEY